MSSDDWGALGVMMAVVGCLSAAIVTLSIRRALDRTPRGVARPRQVVRVILGVYAAVSIAGFVGGFALAGDPVGRRLTAGFIGVAMSWLLLWFLTLLGAVTRAVWATAHHTSRVQPIPPPSSERPS